MSKTTTPGPTTKPINLSKGGNSYTTSTQEAFQSPDSRRGVNKENLRVDFTYSLATGTQHRTLSQALLEAQDVIDPENTGGVWQCKISCFPKKRNVSFIHSRDG